MILALDTCLAGGGAALAHGGKVLAQALLEPGPGFSRRLLPAIEQVMHQAGASRSELTGLAVTIGPGFFTGLRVALATAQGMALGLDLPVAGVSSLRLLAEAAPEGRRVVWSLADARRGLLYAACFEQDGESFTRREADMAITPERLLPLLEPPALLLGPGARLIDPANLAPGLELAPEAMDQPSPGLLALIGARRLAHGKGLAPHQLRPRYCRPSDAEVRFGLPLDDYHLVQ
ncbi:MAG: tRNA (adenosine(37)-N6)-threonylcarbamoyltransferase complex dimerization subunit type 1 TsaB [Deltaproteobacteria bacterium]|nr:tRNA (adenosine(37)-N6)-threonylcarbamoyltransferase complex dimerization subunit type 1 TsaB [Deltaproteobacteria bacterium]